MGNTSGVSCLKDGAEGTHLNKYLTPRQLQLVQDTWDIMKTDLPTLGLTVFLKLFQTEPDLKRLFPKIVQMNDKNELEWEVDKDMLQRLWPSLNHGFQTMLGEAYTKETMEAWRRLYSYISAQMKRGMNDPDAKLACDDDGTT
ncbi:cytoglobin-1 [Plakobranchus ocellatus]|uniref:Globin n=1 Tax=Plakobranchus ocellatus TaxID=259542 RepID=A0AAV3Z2B9_9GAST|nr:cytoglobin-1 [Plakobranchus ocellatus]